MGPFILEQDVPIVYLKSSNTTGTNSSPALQEIPKAKAKEATHPDYPSLSVGDRVIIATPGLHSMFYSQGDSGTVLRSLPPVMEARHLGSKYALAVVELDDPKDPSVPVVTLNRWKVAPLILAPEV